MPRDIEVGLALPTFCPKGAELDHGLMTRTAVWAEQKGFDTVWVPDHIFHGWQIMEALVCLSFVAARTSTIRLGTGVLLLPMRQISIAAAQLSTLSILSEGRLQLGIGVGGEWPKEWEAAGVKLSERGARLDEQIPLLLRLFAGDTIEFNGRFNSFPGVQLCPQPPHVPLYFAGRAEAAIERVAKFGDAWLAYYLTPSGFKRDKAKLDQARERLGQANRPFRYGMTLPFYFDAKNDDTDLRAAQLMNASFPPGLALTPDETLRRFVLAGTPARVLERLQEYIDEGCDCLCVSPVETGTAREEHLDIFASEVLPRLKSSR